jgi:protein-tyrosine-phosphatase
MAAAILRHLAGHRIYARSAGVRAGERDHFTIVVMNEIGIDISAHQPKTIGELNDNAFDLIVTLSPEAHHQALELTRTWAVDVEYWQIMDPSHTDGSREVILDAYRACREALFRSVKERFDIAGAPHI